MEGAWDAMGQEGWVGAHLRGATSFFSTGAADTTTREARRGAVTRAGALRLTSDATTDILIGRTVLTRGRAGACRGFGATRREHVAVQELLVEVVRAVGADVGETTLATVSLRGVKPRACAWTTSAIGRLHTCSMGKVEVYDSKTRPNTADTEIPRASTRPPPVDRLHTPQASRAASTDRKHGSGLEPRCASPTRVSLFALLTARVHESTSPGRRRRRRRLPGGRFRCRVTRAARSDPPPRPSLTDTVPLPRVDLTYPPTFLRIRSRTHQEEAQRRHERRAQVRGRGAHPSIAFSFPADGVQRRASFPPQSR